MDNLAPHKNDQTVALILAAGAHVRFLPAYPDFRYWRLRAVEVVDGACHEAEGRHYTVGSPRRSRQTNHFGRPNAQKTSKTTFSCGSRATPRTSTPLR